MPHHLSVGKGEAAEGFTPAGKKRFHLHTERDQRKSNETGTQQGEGRPTVEFRFPGKLLHFVLKIMNKVEKERWEIRLQCHPDIINGQICQGLTVIESFHISILIFSKPLTAFTVKRSH